MREKLALAVLTGLGLGFSPFASGTCGTFLGVGQFLVLVHFQAEWALLPLAALWTLATCWLAPIAISRYGRKDPGQVVSDEIAGFLVAVSFTAWAGPHVALRGAAAFFLFRLFDVLKPWPISRLEDLPAGYGIALDDIGAGVVANVGLQLILLLSC